MSKDRERAAGQSAPSSPLQPPSPQSLEQSFLTLRTEIDRVLEGFVRDMAPPLRWRGTGHNAFGRVELEIGTGDRITPPADMIETAEGYQLTVELPGLSQEDVEVALTEDSVVVSGVKDEGELDDSMRLHLRERRYGTFRRAFGVPPDVDRAAIADRADRLAITVETMPVSVNQDPSDRRQHRGGAAGGPYLVRVDGR